MTVNVAIDGPAGAGKSTIARTAAERLGFIYVDTGALYRTVAVAALRNSTDTSDENAVANLLEDIKVQLKFINGEQHVLLNGEDVSEEIRLEKASMAASKVSAIPSVRKFLFGLQKKLAEENDVIMDGRDIGSVVLPNAQVKIFLTASPEIRATRRVRQLEEKGVKSDYDEILKDIIQRDYQDEHREIAPLKKTEDAVLVDTSDCDLEQSIERVLGVIKDKIG